MATRNPAIRAISQPQELLPRIGVGTYMEKDHVLRHARARFNHKETVDPGDSPPDLGMQLNFPEPPTFPHDLPVRLPPTGPYVLEKIRGKLGKPQDTRKNQEEQRNLPHHFPAF
ncbi:MAG: hypothetical protein ACUVQS_03655 [Candidatus Bipolaricaulaceae bacterium]